MHKLTDKFSGQKPKIIQPKVPEDYFKYNNNIMDPLIKTCPSTPELEPRGYSVPYRARQSR